MKLFSTSTHTLLVALCVFSIALTGCDSNDDGDFTDEEALEAVSEMADKVFSVTGQLAFGIGTAAKTAEASSLPVYECPEGGSVDYQLDLTGSSYTMAFDDCNGINGSLTYGVSYTVTDTVFDFDVSMDGTVTEECSMTFDLFQQSVGVDITDPENFTYDYTLNGSFSATCGSATVYACSFDNVSLDLESEDDDFLYTESCALTGVSS